MNKKQNKKGHRPTSSKSVTIEVLNDVPLSKPSLEDIQRKQLQNFIKENFVEEAAERNKSFKSEVERFVEISKFFSSPLRKTASYLCDSLLVSCPKVLRLEYKRGGVTTHQIQFNNLLLEAVYVKLFKIIPDLNQFKFINLSFSRCRRIPPGLSFILGFLYDDVDANPPTGDAKMVFVASRKTTTPCYQVCEIRIIFEPHRLRSSRSRE